MAIYQNILKGRRKKIAVIPIGVDTRIFRPLVTEKKGDIFFLSVLDEYHEFKGLDVLLGAIRIVKSEIPDLKLIVGGEGALKDYYMRGLEIHGLKRKC